MPIARRPSLPTLGAYEALNQHIITPTDVFVPNGMTIAAGSAVALVVSNGDLEYRLCGALPDDHPQKFYGFFVQTINANGLAPVAVGRGSKVTVRVEGNVDLVMGDPVFLSATPGLVTQGTDFVAGSEILRVGYAVGIAQLVINTDARFGFSG